MFVGKRSNMRTFNSFNNALWHIPQSVSSKSLAADPCRALMQIPNWVYTTVSQMAFNTGCTTIMQCSHSACMSACLLFSSPSLCSFSANLKNPAFKESSLKCAYFTSPKRLLGHTRALGAVCRVAQPAVALTTMPPQLWSPLPLLLLCASLVTTRIGAEAAAAAMMPNNGDRFGNVAHAH